MNYEIHELKKIDWMKLPTTIYRGTLVTRYIGGYSVLGVLVKTPEEVDNVININSTYDTTEEMAALLIRNSKA